MNLIVRICALIGLALSVKETSELEIDTSTSSKSNLGIRDHPNFHLLPTLNECGFGGGTNANGSASGTDNSESDGDSDLSLRRRKRIVGGQPAEIGADPWMVQIMTFNDSDSSHTGYCVGTLINNETVLTSAACVAPDPKGKLYDTHVLVGSYTDEIFNEYSSPTRLRCMTRLGIETCYQMFMVEIDRIKIHEEYLRKDKENLNDIALVKLKKDIYSLDKDPYYNVTHSSEKSETTNQRFLRPICLPLGNELEYEDGEAELVEAVGWGRTNHHEYSNWWADSLLRLDMKVVPNDYCTEFLGLPGRSFDTTRLCALADPGKSPCYGDVGSPLKKSVVLPDGRTRAVQVGILSGMERYEELAGCGVQGVPFDYINVQAYISWILDNLE